MSDTDPPPAEAPPNITLTAVVFEVSLALVAMAIGWGVGRSPVRSVTPAWEAWPEHAAALGWGALATLPMLIGLWLVEKLPLDGLARLRRVVDDRIMPLFANLTYSDLLAVALAAGLGEEILFRGLLQAELMRWWGPIAGLAAASLIFGLCHAITRVYALLAALIGLYLGLLFWWTDNLLAPIAAHTLYDFAALVYLARWKDGIRAELTREKGQETRDEE